VQWRNDDPCTLILAARTRRNRHLAHKLARENAATGTKAAANAGRVCAPRIRPSPGEPRIRPSPGEKPRPSIRLRVWFGLSALSPQENKKRTFECKRCQTTLCKNSKSSPTRPSRIRTMIAGEATPSSQRIQDACSGTARPRACDHRIGTRENECVSLDHWLSSIRGASRALLAQLLHVVCADPSACEASRPRAAQQLRASRVWPERCMRVGNDKRREVRNQSSRG
jgi:hypothetical protein